MLLVLGKQLIFGPPFLFQISNDVQSSRLCCLVTPKFAHLSEELASVISEQFVGQHISKLPDKPIFHPFTGPRCFTQEREARFYRWIEPKTADRNTAPHFIPAMLLNKLIEDVPQRNAV
jgi:hypothetical protein